MPNLAAGAAVLSAVSRKKASESEENTDKWYRRPGRIIAWIVVALLVVSIGRGVINELTFNLIPDIPAPLSSVQEFQLDQPVPAEIVKVEPIAIECRATVNAIIPLALQKNVHYSVFGAELFSRSEHGFYTAYGDVDVCVGVDNTKVIGTADFGWDVQVDASDIEFRRPRVDTIRSAHSWELHTDWGWVPGIDGDDGMGTEATALAQLFIGSSECMEAAWEATESVIVSSYEQQALAQGVDPALVNVSISGTPDFKQYVNSYMSEYDDGTIEWVESLIEEYGFEKTDPDDEDYRRVECRLHEDLVQAVPHTKLGTSDEVGA